MTIKEENNLDLKIIEKLCKKEGKISKYDIISHHNIQCCRYPSNDNNIKYNQNIPYMKDLEDLLKFNKWYDDTFSKSTNDYLIAKGEYLYLLAKHRNSKAKYFIKKIHSVFPYFGDDWVVLKTNFTIPLFHDIITIIKTILIFILENKDKYIEYLSICFTAEITCMTDYIRIDFNKYTNGDLEWVKKQVDTNGCIPIFCNYECTNSIIPNIVRQRVNLLEIIQYMKEDI